MYPNKTGAAVALEDKAIVEADDAWIFTGYASIFNTKDLGNDVVLPGAYQKSLRDHGLPLILLNHKTDDLPVGTCLEAKEDKRGLWIKGALPKDDALCRDRLVPQLKRRGLKGMSIGYRALETEKRKSDGARLLKEIRLFECSFVSLPMHPDAGLETIKGDRASIDELVRELRNTMRCLDAALQPDPLQELTANMKAFAELANELALKTRAESDPFARAELALQQLMAQVAKYY